MELNIRFKERRDIDFMVYWYHQSKSGDMHAFEHIKYLHQLQNLIYSLTGKELNIEL
jgi:hypothetical protein